MTALLLSNLGCYASFKTVFFVVLVVPSKLSWGRTFDKFISVVTSLIYQNKPNYKPYKRDF